MWDFEDFAGAFVSFEIEADLTTAGDEAGNETRPARDAEMYIAIGIEERLSVRIDAKLQGLGGLRRETRQSCARECVRGKIFAARSIELETLHPSMLGLGEHPQSALKDGRVFEVVRERIPEIQGVGFHAAIRQLRPSYAGLSGCAAAAAQLRRKRRPVYRQCSSSGCPSSACQKSIWSRRLKLNRSPTSSCRLLCATNRRHRRHYHRCRLRL